jgi:quercetin dioxygenase-like cupin family protein
MAKNEQKPHINVDFFEDLTGDIKEIDQGVTEDIGQRLRILLKEKKLTLDELANLTGFDVEFLSKIENNDVHPQLGTVIKLSKALDGAFSRLISGVGSRLYSVTRKADQKIISRSTAQKGKKQAYTYKSLAPEVKGRHMEALIVHLEENPGANLSVHDGEEFIYVLSGNAIITIGKETFILEPGDSIYYLSTTPHLIAAHEKQATILAVIYDK